MPVTSSHPASASAQLSTDCQVDDTFVALRVGGELDLASAPLLEEQLREATSSSPRRIQLDLGGLRFIDSTGIKVLIDAQQRANVSGQVLVLTNVPHRALRLFHLTGVDASFLIE